MRDSEHLLRLAGVFAVGVLTFLLLRAFLVPRSFGEFGHYRGDAISEVAALPVKYAGHQTCEGCHGDPGDKSKGKHARIACEACHGPLDKHAEDPVSIVPVKPDPAKLCVTCHEASAAKPKWFPQVDSKEHSAGAACNACHRPHNPGFDTGESARQEGKEEKQ
jgi:hypothetical protein